MAWWNLEDAPLDITIGDDNALAPASRWERASVRHAGAHSREQQVEKNEPGSSCTHDSSLGSTSGPGIQHQHRDQHKTTVDA
jgi:hypothetical protein